MCTTTCFTPHVHSKLIDSSQRPIKNRSRALSICVTVEKSEVAIAFEEVLLADEDEDEDVSLKLDAVTLDAELVATSIDVEAFCRGVTDVSSPKTTFLVVLMPLEVD